MLARRSRRLRPQGLALGALVAAAVFGISASAALGREAYVPNYQANTVSVIDTATGQPIGAPIPTGAVSGPYTLAISPNGGVAYAADYDGGNVLAISTQSKSVIGAPIPVGAEPIGIAITPDGTRAYVCNAGADSVSVIDLQTGQVVGLPIPVGKRPQGIAITPDGSRAFVGNNGAKSVSVIDTGTNQVVGAPIEVGVGPYGVAVTPDGKRVFVANNGSETVSVIDVATLQVVGAQIPAGEDPSGVAITPDGTRAYVASSGSDSVSVIDTAAAANVGSIAGIQEAEFVAITPDGTRGFVSQFGPGGVTPFSVQANQLLGPLIKTGGGTGQPAIVPNQPPLAAFSTKRVRPGVAATLNASASTDPDGTVATFAWSFGDGEAASVATPTVTHTFAKPGKYAATLTLTDNEGCSTARVFTGQTAYCNGAATAALTGTIVVAFPGLRLRCPKSAKPGGCKFSLRAVAVKGRGKNKRLKAQSAKARAKVKPGGSKIVSLKPTKAFRKRLAGAKKILVQLSRTIDGDTQTAVRKLKVVR